MPCFREHRPEKTPKAAASENVFACSAMATTFTIRVIEADPVYARQAAAAAFEELDLLDRHLSRYIESSDVSRLNRLTAEQSSVVALETFDCLRIALDLTGQTGGAFNVAYASSGAARATGIRLHSSGPSVEVTDSGVVIDLGGIGKGFALDRMAAVLREWDIAAALLWASTSTVLALGSPAGQQGWRLSFGSDYERRQILLRGTAFSASGTAVKGQHIVDPRTGRLHEESRRRRRAWAAAPTAAEADALSTAFMVMSVEDVRRFCVRNPQMAAYLLVSEDAPLLAVGDHAVE